MNAVSYLANSYAWFDGPNSAPSESFSYTQQPGHYRIVFVVLHTTEGANKITGVTYGGVAMHNLMQLNSGVQGWSTAGHQSIWYLLEHELPDDGTFNVVFTIPTSYSHGFATVFMFENCAQEVPVGQSGIFSEWSTDLTVTCSTPSNGMAFIATTRETEDAPDYGTGYTTMYAFARLSNSYSHGKMRYKAEAAALEQGRIAMDPDPGYMWMTVEMAPFVGYSKASVNIF